jgi:hypothetical protein
MVTALIHMLKGYRFMMASPKLPKLCFAWSADDLRERLGNLEKDGCKFSRCHASMYIKYDCNN